MKKSLNFLLLLFIFVSVKAQKEVVKNPVAEVSLNSNWSFNYFPGENPTGGYEAAGYNDLNWPLISLPHTWSTYETTGDIHPYIRDTSEYNNPYWWRGWGWYRKYFTIDGIDPAKKVFIEFEGVQKYCKVWVNGKYLGDHKGGYGSFDMDITGSLIPGRQNVIAVAVNNRKDDEYRIPPMNPGDFNVYGGITRDVKLVVRNKLYIPMQGSADHEGGTFITTPMVTAKKAIVRIKTWVKNESDQPKSCDLNTYVIDAAGNIVQVLKARALISPGQTYRFDQTSKKVKKPHLWSPERPYLYRVYSEVTDGEKVMDGFTSRFGFRWFRLDNNNSLSINGRQYALNGGLYCQEYPWLGEAVPGWIEEEDVKEYADKDICNLLLTYGHPGHRHLYELTDKHGIIVIEELPNRGNQPFSREIQEQQLKEMIRRDRNHPSIFFWSMGSLTDNPADSRLAYAEDSTRVITSYKTTGASAGTVSVHTYDDIPLNELERYPFTEGKKSDSGTSSGEPAKIILKGSHKKIPADRASVVIITADITDSQGRIVEGAGNTIKWSVTGPATLAGPVVFESESSRYVSDKSLKYNEMPVFNVIRSTGGTGRVRVTVSSSGLASGSFEFDAEEIKRDNTVISEPVLNEEGRRPVPKAVLVIERLEEIPQEIKAATADINVQGADRQTYFKSIGDHIYRNNPAVDTTTVEFRTLANLFAGYLVNNNGKLSAGDFNFSVNHYNNCRLISGYIDATKLPPLFKEELKRYYSEAVIRYGTEKNAGDEMNWMNWIPSGGTVVISQADDNSWPAGTVLTDKTGLHDIIAAVYPVFSSYSDAATERALTFVSKMNPYVHELQENGRTVYRAEKGKAILVPLIKFIAQ